MHYPERRTEQTSPLLLFFLFSFLSKMLWSYYRSPDPMLQMGEQRGTHDGSLSTYVFGFLSNKQWRSGLSTQLKGLGNAPKAPSSDVPEQALMAIFTFSILCSPYWHTPHTDFKGKWYESIPTLPALTLPTHWPYAFQNVASLALPLQHIGWKQVLWRLFFDSGYCLNSTQ